MNNLPKENMQSKSKAKIQKAILGLLLLAKEATFDLKSTFTLNIDNGLGIVDFEDEGRDFSPKGYDERDTVAGICLDLDNNTLLVMTNDSEGNTNFLTPEQTDIGQADWIEVYDVLHAILSRGLVIEA